MLKGEQETKKEKRKKKLKRLQNENSNHYFILQGWCRTQKHSNSHMFDKISGFTTFWFSTLPPEPEDLPIGWATPSEGHDAIMTSTNWPKCLS